VTLSQNKHKSSRKILTFFNNIRIIKKKNISPRRWILWSNQRSGGTKFWGETKA